MQGYYSVYGGSSQYQVYGSTGLSNATSAFYPYMNFGEGSGNGCYTASQGYGVQYSHHLFPYSAAGLGYPTQHYGTPISVAPSPALHSGLYNYLLFYLILIIWRGTNIFDSLFCCATGVTITLHSPIPHQ